MQTLLALIPDHTGKHPRYEPGAAPYSANWLMHSPTLNLVVVEVEGASAASLARFRADYPTAREITETAALPGDGGEWRVLVGDVADDDPQLALDPAAPRTARHGQARRERMLLRERIIGRRAAEQTAAGRHGHAVSPYVSEADLADERERVRRERGGQGQGQGGATVALPPAATLTPDPGAQGGAKK